MGASVLYESASELVTLENTFYVGGAATDPAEVTLVVKSPTGTTTTYTYGLLEITKVSVGKYQKIVPCNEAGEWEYVWTGTVTATDVVSGTFTVFPLQLGKLYAPVDALKSRKGIPLGTDTQDDYELHLACFTASRCIEDYCGRIFYRSEADTVRTFVPRGSYRFDAPAFNDIVSVSSLKTDETGDGVFETAWDTSDYQLLWNGDTNPTAYSDPRPYNQIRTVGTKTFPCHLTNLARDDRIQITGIFGWPSVPWQIKQAALVLAEDIFTSKEDAFRSGGYNEFGRIRARQNPNVVLLCSELRRGDTVFPVART